MSTEIFWLSRHPEIDAIGPWDTGLLRHLFEGRLARNRVEYTSSWRTVDSLPDDHGNEPAIVVLPARHHYKDVTWLNNELSKLKSVVLVLVGDEDAKFPWKQVVHGRIRFWVQMPDPKNYGDMMPWAFFFGNGWRYEFPDEVNKHGFDRRDNWVFAGQVTNAARVRAVKGLRHANRRVPGLLLETDGFARGIEMPAYVEALAGSWVAPAPGGPMSVDTFRLYEALEAGCVPLVDHFPATGESASAYWRNVYPDGFPFDTVFQWDGVGGLIESVMENPYWYSAACSSWWQQTKRAMVRRMESDLAELGTEVIVPRVTAVVTTSPVPGNPSLDMITETILSIPPEFDVIVACDGVRPEQEHLADGYKEFMYRLCVACERDPRFENVTPYVSPRWLHQAGLTRSVLARPTLVDTHAILFMEHDTPIVPDEPIDWSPAVEIVAEGFLHVLRFHHEAHVHEEHEHLMTDHQTNDILGLPVRRTRQWSQRPHLANTDYYRRILDQNFPAAARTMIEDRMHSVAQWQRGHRIAVYHPDGGNIKRSYHLDGRGDEPKFDMKFGDE